MTERRGEIYDEQAYAQSKMLDHSGWESLLPRNITPSDIDEVFDNNGFIILREISRHHSEWKHLQQGQRRLFENLVKNAPHKHVAILWTHDVPKDKQIDTVKNVASFQLMFGRRLAPNHPNVLVKVMPVQPGTELVDFVTSWYRNPTSVLEALQASDRACRLDRILKEDV